MFVPREYTELDRQGSRETHYALHPWFVLSFSDLISPRPVSLSTFLPGVFPSGFNHLSP